MPLSMTNLNLVGMLAHDPRFYATRQDGTGGARALLTIPDNQGYLNRDGDEEERTTWYDVWLYGPRAEFARDRLHKGSFVVVFGEIRGVRVYRDPKDLDAEPWTSITVVVNRMRYAPDGRSRERDIDETIKEGDDPAPEGGEEIDEPREPAELPPMTFDPNFDPEDWPW